MPLIECKNLSLSYEHRIVLSNLSFSVAAGDYLCVVGENGSGKSTLVRALLGLKSPAGGEIILGDGLTRNGIGYLPQQSDLQRDFPASVGEVVLSGCLNASRSPFYTRAQRERAQENMSLLGLDEVKRACYRELSGGQQQRVLLARALCAAQKLLLLDEPAAGLDPLVGEQMYHTVCDINRRGMTIIMVSHDVRAAVRDASHILHLHNTPLFFGTAEDYRNSATGRAFLAGENHA